LTTDQPTPNLQPELCSLDTVHSRAMDWIWQPYLPSAMLTMLSGDPGTGKTYLALAIAAALTAGRVPGADGDSTPAEPSSPVDVLYLSVENNPERVLRPRFDRMGGDPQRFHLLQGIFQGEGNGAQWSRVRLTDMAVLEKALFQTGARLVIVDPLQSFLGPGMNTQRGDQVRPVMDSLCELAETHDCAVLLIRHLSKSKTGRALARGLGSIDLTGAVRSEMLAGSAGQDDATQERALIHVKSNVGQMGPAVGYRIAEDGAFAWTGTSDLAASDLLGASTPAGDSPTSIAVAEDFLRQTLKKDRFSLATDVLFEAKRLGIAPRTLYRAKARLNVLSRRDNHEALPMWWWHLPEEKKENEEVRPPPAVSA